VRAEVRNRALGRPAQRAALAHARQSSCGRRAATRCCLYAGPEDVTGRCRIVRTAACDAHAAAGEAADRGPGSCLPAPCTR